KNAEKLNQRNVVTTVRNESQLGFGGACRVGYEQGESPYVCFLNSDCRIEDSGWLRSLGESLLKLKHENVRVIAPMTNNPMSGDPAQLGDKSTRSQDDVIIED